MSVAGVWVCGGVLAFAPGPALAASSGTVGGVSAAIAVAPSVFDYRRTEMHYALTFTTGAAEERFAIEVHPPRFPRFEGSPFLEPGP